MKINIQRKSREKKGLNKRKRDNEKNMQKEKR